MAFHDTKKNNGYHSLFIKLFGHVHGGRFFPDTVYVIMLGINQWLLLAVCL